MIPNVAVSQKSVFLHSRRENDAHNCDLSDERSRTKGVFSTGLMVLCLGFSGVVVGLRNKGRKKFA